MNVRLRTRSGSSTFVCFRWLTRTCSWRIRSKSRNLTVWNAPQCPRTRRRIWMSAVFSPCALIVGARDGLTRARCQFGIGFRNSSQIRQDQSHTDCVPTAEPIFIPTSESRFTLGATSILGTKSSNVQRRRCFGEALRLPWRDEDSP